MARRQRASPVAAPIGRRSLEPRARSRLPATAGALRRLGPHDPRSPRRASGAGEGGIGGVARSRACRCACLIPLARNRKPVVRISQYGPDFPPCNATRIILHEACAAYEEGGSHHRLGVLAFLGLCRRDYMSGARCISERSAVCNGAYFPTDVMELHRVQMRPRPSDCNNPRA